MDRLSLGPDGLTRFSHNEELQGKYRYKKRDDKFLLVERETGKELVFESEAERENVFWEIKEVEYIFTHLRDELRIQPGTTIANLTAVIAKFPELEVLVTQLFPTYPEIRGSKGDEPAEAMLVLQEGEVVRDELKNKSFFEIKTYLGTTNGQRWTPETEIEVVQEFTIRDGEDVHNSGRIISLFELIVAIYEMDDRLPSALTKEGLFDVSGQKVENPLQYLLNPVEVSEDFTVGDVLGFVEQNDLLKTFISLYAWCWQIDDFHAEAKKPRTRTDDDLWYLELYRHFSIDDYCDLNLDVEAHAIGELDKDTKEHYDSHPLETRPNHMHYGIGFVSINEIAHLPIVCKHDVKVHVYKKKSKGRELLKTKEWQVNFTLLDILTAIYWEISFYGGPEEKNAMKSEMQSRIEQIKETGTDDLPELKLPEDEGQ